MVRVLVTGGLGFIGSNLVELLSNLGIDVVILDNMTTGTKDNVKDLRVKNFIKGGIENFKKVKKASKNCDYIFNLAACSNSVMFKDNPQTGIHQNVDGFINLMNAAIENQVNKVIYASSSSIYGNTCKIKKQSISDPVQPINLYAATKIMNEMTADNYWRMFGLNSIGLRFFSVYGPRERAKKTYANVISQMFWALEKDEQFVIRGKGEFTRDFTYVSDICNTMRAAMDSDIDYGVYNVGTGTSTTYKKAYELVKNQMGKNIEPAYQPSFDDTGFQYHTWADTKDTEKDLKYKAKVDLKTGVKWMVEET